MARGRPAAIVQDGKCPCITPGPSPHFLAHYPPPLFPNPPSYFFLIHFPNPPIEKKKEISSSNSSLGKLLPLRFGLPPCRDTSWTVADVTMETPSFIKLIWSNLEYEARKEALSKRLVTGQSSWFIPCSSVLFLYIFKSPSPFVLS